MNQGTFLFELCFHLFPHPEISREVTELFELKINSFIWSVSQDGNIISAKFDGFLGRNVLIDTEDEQTLRSLKLLPRFFARKLSTAEKKAWRLKVDYREFQETDKETDWVILIDDKIHLEKVYQSWQHMAVNFKDLMAEVEKIRDLIQ